MLAAISYIHIIGIAHLDLKPKNILLDGQCNIKITGFSGANLLAGKQGDGMLRGSCGTKGYFAPEIFENKPY
jgi:serine/threonine protein kinase